MAEFSGFPKLCSGPPKFKIFLGPLGPGPAGPWVNASLRIVTHLRKLPGTLEAQWQMPSFEDP